MFITLNNFSQSYYRVKVNGLWGAIDSTGKIVIKPLYNEKSMACGENNQYFIGVKKDTTILYNSLLNTVDTYFLSYLSYAGEGFFNFAPILKSAVNKNVLYKNSIKKLVDTFHDDFGIMSYSGHVIFRPILYMTAQFKDGLARICFYNRDQSNERTKSCGIINTTGNWVVNPEFSPDCLWSSVKGLIIFKKNDVCGVMDVKGNIIIKPKYKFLDVCNNKYLLYRVHDIKGEWGLMTVNEKVIFRYNRKKWIDYSPACESDTLVVINRVNDNIFSYLLGKHIVKSLSGHKVFRNNIYRLDAEKWGTFVSHDGYDILFDCKGKNLTCDSSYVIEGEQYPLMKVHLGRMKGFIDHTVSVPV